jgi:hypothetical protein
LVGLTRAGETTGVSVFCSGLGWGEGGEGVSTCTTTTGSEAAVGEASNFAKSKAAAHGLSFVRGRGTKTGAEAETEGGGENGAAEADSVDLVKLDIPFSCNHCRNPRKPKKKTSSGQGFK